MQNNSLQLYADVCNQILNHEFVNIHVEINLTIQTCSCHACQHPSFEMTFFKLKWLKTAFTEILFPKTLFLSSTVHMQLALMKCCCDKSNFHPDHSFQEYWINKYTFVTGEMVNSKVKLAIMARNCILRNSIS